MKSTKKYFVEERFRMTPMPYWWQLFKWIKYVWRKLLYMAWKNRGQTFRKCIVCKNKLINNYCENCQLDYKEWIIESIDVQKYTQLLGRIGEMKSPNNRILIDESIAQTFEKSSLRPLENYLKGIEKLHHTNWKPLTEKQKNNLLVRFTKFPTITRKEIVKYRRNNPIN